MVTSGVGALLGLVEEFRGLVGRLSAIGSGIFQILFSIESRVCPRNKELLDTWTHLVCSVKCLVNTLSVCVPKHIVDKIHKEYELLEQSFKEPDNPSRVTDRLVFPTGQRISSGAWWGCRVVLVFSGPSAFRKFWKGDRFLQALPAGVLTMHVAFTGVLSAEPIVASPTLVA